MNLQKSKFKIVGIAVGVLVVIAVILCLILVPKSDGGIKIEKFRLSEEYYGDFGVMAITAGEYNELIDKDKSFLVLVHLATCPAELPLTDVTKQFSKTENIKVYSLISNEFKDTELFDEFKFLPSLVIIHDGKMVKYLDAESNEDLPAYKSVGGLSEWVFEVVER